MFTVTIGYILLGLFIWRIEWVRIRKYGPDLFTLFIFILFLQMILPGICLTAVIAFLDDLPDTGVPFFNKVLTDVSVYEASLVLVLLYLFLMSSYATWLAIHSTVNLQKICVPKIRVYVSLWRWLTIMFIGLIGSWVLLKELGGYDKLIVFRTDWLSPTKTFVTANLFSLTMTYMTLSIVGVMMFWGKKTSLKFVFSLMLVVGFSLMTVSRRAFGIVILLSLFTLVLEKKRFYIRETIIFTVLFMPVIVFGKRVLWLIGHNSNVTVSAITSGQGESFSGLLLFIANIGTSTIESWATLLYLDIPMRFGVDHLLSIARRIPERILGIDINFPERMVRISTEAFLSAERNDVPPGLIGQMWLDFGLLGPIVWAIFYGLVISVLQLTYNRLGKDRAVILLFVILLWVICLPINTGSLDFVFSIDNIFLLIFSIFIIKIKQKKNYR